MSKEEDFKQIAQAVMNTYHEKMHDYLNSNPQGSLTDADVIIMIMNLTMSVATNIYYSVKQILPSSQLDYDFMKVKLSNSLADSFDKIKQYTPKESIMPLTVEQIEEIMKNGFAIITMPDGSTRKISENEVLVKKEDAEKLIKETKEAPHSKKIIVPSNRVKTPIN